MNRLSHVTKLAFLLIVMPLTVASCDPSEEFKTELSEIDQHLADLDSLENLLHGIDFDSLAFMVEHVKENEALIKELYRPDTLNEEFGRLMNDSKSVRKGLATVGDDQVLYSDELNAVKHQFIDLKEDIQNGVLDEAQVKEYLSVENAALDKVSLSFGSFYRMVSAERYRFYSVTPRVDEFIEGLKTKNDQLD